MKLLKDEILYNTLIAIIGSLFLYIAVYFNQTLAFIGVWFISFVIYYRKRNNEFQFFYLLPYTKAQLYGYLRLPFLIVAVPFGYLIYQQFQSASYYLLYYLFWVGIICFIHRINLQQRMPFVIIFMVLNLPLSVVPESNESRMILTGICILVGLIEVGIYIYNLFDMREDLI